MNAKSQSAIVAQTTSVNLKTNLGLINYCKAQIGKPYWYGTFGQLSTKDLYENRKKVYPKYYTADNYLEQLGVKVHDCIGLLKGYMWCKSPDDSKPEYLDNGMKDLSANMMWEHCTNKSTDMGKIPEIPGIAVFMAGHIGYYLGNNEVIEARGHDYGVVITKLNKRPWKRWAYIPEIKYLGL